MPAVNGFQLTNNDIEILQQVYNHRLLRIDHLIALTSRPHKRLHRRILKLLERSYLARIVLPNEKHIYTIGRAAVPILVEQGIASKELIDFRLRHHELKELFLKHILLVVEIHAVLELATRQTHIKLVAWNEGQELYDSVTVQEKGSRRRLPVRPDGFFILQDTERPPEKNILPFFLEADRSTTTHARFMKKITAYWEYLNQGLYTKKYNRKFFRVVTITLTDERAANLAADARAVLPAPAHRFFLFSSVKQFSLETPQAILGDIFITPRDLDGHRARLVPPSAPQQGSDNSL